jgi:hypothetical protein
VIKVLKAMVVTIGVAMVFTIVFVKSKTLGGDSGGQQASDIINATTKGFAEIVRAGTGS